MRAFISYSHTDEQAVESFHKHLSVLKRNGNISAWYDRDILGGNRIDDEIKTNLDSADLFFAIVSPDFLASNYCYETEMSQAFSMQEAGKIRILPIIVQPCDWQTSPLGNLKAVPKDGKPISEWLNKNSAWLDVIHEIRRIIDSASSPANKVEAVEYLSEKSSARKYRVEKEYDELDKSDFRDRAFLDISNYFQESISELDQVEGMKARFRKLSDISFSCSVFNKLTKNGQAHITVSLRRGREGIGDISYIFDENADGRSANGWFQVEADKYELYLSINDFSSQFDNKSRRLSPRQIAEFLWTQFVGNAGVSYE